MKDKFKVIRFTPGLIIQVLAGMECQREANISKQGETLME